jgi:hypothetical protein
LDADALLRKQFPNLCSAENVAELISIGHAAPPSGSAASIQKELELLEQSLPIAPIVRPAATRQVSAKAPEPTLPPPPLGASLVGQQLDVLATEIRSLEGALQRERVNSKQYYDYARALEHRVKDLESQATQTASQIASANQNEISLQRIRAALSAELARAKDELVQYRRAWTDVLKRDQEARRILDTHTALQKRLEQVEQYARGVHQQYVAEKNRADLNDARAGDADLKLTQVTGLLEEAEVKAELKVQEARSLQELCKAYEQRIQQLESGRAQAIQETRETAPTAALAEQERIVAAMRAEQEKALAAIRDERDAAAEKELSRIRAEHGRENLAVQGAMSAMRSELIAKDEEIRIRVRDERSRRDQLADGEARVFALRAECEALQSILISEKTRFRDIADRVVDELAKAEGGGFDSTLLDDLADASSLSTVATTRGEPRVDC